MSSGPSKIAETIVGVFVPPACREEVLGDLYERYRSAGRYGLDAARTVPLVIASRIRRTANAQVLPMQAFALYEAFLGAAWFTNRAFLSERWGLPRLAIPTAIRTARIAPGGRLCKARGAILIAVGARPTVRCAVRAGIARLAADDRLGSRASELDPVLRVRVRLRVVLRTAPVVSTGQRSLAGN